ncbi:MAG: branched-chain amino acid ABC transporter permease, partial [candidate division WOR-3 bacterium]|nr:branched-chain amino acid ABC transporter permease [candidate division WOR-3 bacterium]
MRIPNLKLTYSSLIIFLVLFPLVVRGQYFMHIIIMSGIFMMQASALNLIYGYAGQLSLGHQAFWGISGYTSALLALKLGWSFWICLPAAGIFALVTGAFIGFITLRLR